MKNCVYCGRENAGDATVCHECGTPLTAPQSDSHESQTQVSDNPAVAVAEKRMLRGALWCGGGILVTVITYLAAASSSGGGTYFIAWGAIVFGAIEFFRGLGGRHEHSSTEDIGYEALACATNLETEGRVHEALAAYQKIAERYPDTAAGRDAKKSHDSLQARLG